MATYVPPKRATAYKFYVGLVDQSNTKLLKANPTIAAGDFKVSKDGGAFANLTTLPSANPASGRAVMIDLDATEMTADNLVVQCVDAAGAEWCDLLINIQTAARQIDDLAYPATSGRSMAVDASGNVAADAKLWLGGTIATPTVTGVPEVDVTHLLGTPWLAPSTAGTPDVNVKLWNALTTVALPLVPTTAGRTLDVSATGEAGVDWANVGSQSTSVNLSATTVNLVNTTTTLTNAPSDSSGITTLLSRLSAARATKLDAISLRDGTAQAGAAGTITLDASASATDDLYNGLWVILESGTGAAQARLITDYVGATKVATIAPNWTTNPDATSVFALVPAAKISGVTLTDTVTTYTGNTPQTGDNFARLGAPAGASVSADIAAVKVDTAAILVDTGTTLDGRIPAALVGGKMDANVGAISTDTVAADNLEAMLDGTGGVTLSAILGTDAITATSMATGSIDALALATDAVDEIAAAILVTPSQKIATDASNRIDVGKVGGDTSTVTNMVRSFRSVIIDTMGASSTTTSFNTANLVGTVVDQFKDRVLTFRDDTTTAALRGQSTTISASSAATPTVLTVVATTTAPITGDAFVIT